MKKIALMFFYTFATIGAVSAQERKAFFHIYNPLGMFQKAGIKLEFKPNKIGFLLDVKHYYGSFPKYPGTQGGLEGRYYFTSENTDKKENFMYSKIFVGHQKYFEGSGSSFTRLQEVPEGNYYGLGAGVGRRLNFNHFFIDINTGLKYTKSSVSQDKAFYVTGPASILDLHFNLGFRF